MKEWIKFAALAAALTAGPALAQEAVSEAALAEAVAVAVAAALAEVKPPEEVSVHSVFIFNTLMFLIGGFLVMWMAAGFTMLEAGLVRTKNVAMQCTKNVALFAVAGIFYYLIGYSLMYPGDYWTVEGVIGAFSMATLEPVGVEASALTNIEYASTASDFFYQVMFCATTASIVSGTLAERIKLWPFMIFMVFLTAIIYPIGASWDWGGGFLEKSFGFKDFAGSTLVHSMGGWAALAGVLLLGPRIGKYAADGSVQPIPGSNLPLAALGTFILWLGWFGFNGASQLAMGSVSDVADISRIFANTNIAAAGGTVAAMIATQALYGKVDLTMVLNGALAGLVSITAEPLTPSLGMAMIIGAVGGLIVVFAVPFLDKLKIDDVVGAIPVHLFCGVWGTLAVVLTNSDATLYGQVVSILIIAAFAFVSSLVVWFIINATMGIRVSAEEEIAGLDGAELGLEAYPEFGKGSQFA